MQMIELPGRPSEIDKQFLTPSASQDFTTTNDKDGSAIKFLPLAINDEKEDLSLADIQPWEPIPDSRV